MKPIVILSFLIISFQSFSQDSLVNVNSRNEYLLNKVGSELNLNSNQLDLLKDILILRQNSLDSLNDKNLLTIESFEKVNQSIKKQLKVKLSNLEKDQVKRLQMLEEEYKNKLTWYRDHPEYKLRYEDYLFLF